MKTSRMFRKLSYVLIVFILVSSGSAQGKPKSASSISALGDEAPLPMDQTININNWGLGKADRKLLTEMKYKIDYLYEKSVKVCPGDGWVRYGNFSFLIIDIPTLNWTDARRTCQMLGGDLPIIRSATENNFIISLVKKQKTVTDRGAWLGFVRKAGNNTFYWIDDTPLAKGYTAWSSGEPNNLSEKCGNMFGAETYGKAGKWNDIFCDLNPAYFKQAPVILCKKKAH